MIRKFRYIVSGEKRKLITIGEQENLTEIRRKLSDEIKKFYKHEKTKSKGYY